MVTSAKDYLINELRAISTVKEHARLADIVSCASAIEQAAQLQRQIGSASQCLAARDNHASVIVSEVQNRLDAATLEFTQRSNCASLVTGELQNWRDTAALGLAAGDNLSVLSSETRNQIDAATLEFTQRSNYASVVTSEIQNRLDAAAFGLVARDNLTALSSGIRNQIDAATLEFTKRSNYASVVTSEVQNRLDAATLGLAAGDDFSIVACGGTNNQNSFIDEHISKVQSTYDSIVNKIKGGIEEQLYQTTSLVNEWESLAAPTGIAGHIYNLDQRAPTAVENLALISARTNSVVDGYKTQLEHVISATDNIVQYHSRAMEQIVSTPESLGVAASISEELQLIAVNIREEVYDQQECLPRTSTWHDVASRIAKSIRDSFKQKYREARKQQKLLLKLYRRRIKAIQKLQIDRLIFAVLEYIFRSVGCFHQLLTKLKPTSDGKDDISDSVKDKLLFTVFNHIRDNRNEEIDIERPRKNPKSRDRRDRFTQLSCFIYSTSTGYA